VFRKSFAVEFKSVDEAEGIVDAIVNTTGIVDRQKDIIEPGAFRKAIGGKLPKVVNSHQGSEFLGKVLSMREIMPGDPALPKSLADRHLGAFAVKMQFNLETQAGREMFSNVKGGYVDEWSFMFTIDDAQYDAKGIRHIKLIDEIFEVSPVLVGANQATLTLAAKSASNVRGGLVDHLNGLIDHIVKSDVSHQSQRRSARFSIRTPDGPKYPINDCSDVRDAWSLRGRSSIPRERVERHVRRAARALGCDGPWNDGKSFATAPGEEECEGCAEEKDAMGIPELTGDEAIHTEPFLHALDDIKELISQELAEESLEFECIATLSNLALGLISWYRGEASEYNDNDSNGSMQAYSATPHINATSELTARAIAAGVSAGRSRRR
jgi:HK97 family phage prohead protease